MTLIVHHLQRSQSEPIVWLCEELGLAYELKLYQRKREGLGAPPELKAIHPTGTAPVIQDGNVTIAETGAVMDYILAKYGNGRLVVPPSAPNFADYIFWYHWGIGTLQHAAKLPIFLRQAGVAADSAGMRGAADRIDGALRMLDARLQQSPFLAGDALTAADVYAVFDVTTLRLFAPFALTGRDAVLRWLAALSQRPAYRAMADKAEKGEARGEFPTLRPEAPRHISTY